MAVRPIIGAVLLWIVLCLHALWTTRAHAGNDEGILVGGHAALTGGAVTATVADGSAAWYNPAGIARIAKQSVDVNASVYGIGLITADSFAKFEGQPSQHAKTTDWQLIPSILSYARELSPRLVAAFSIIIPRTTDYDFRTFLQTPDGTHRSLGIDTLGNEYDYIISLGWRLGRNLRLGTSVHGIYFSSEHVIQIARGQPGMEGAPFATFSNHTKLGDYALRVSLGLQWTVSPRFDLGVSLQIPTLTGFRNTFNTTTWSSMRADSPSQFALKEEDDLKSVWELSTPFSARFGGAYKLGRAQLLIDGSIYSRLDSSERVLDRKLTGNARLGCLVEQSELFAFGIGVFTDLSGSRRGAEKEPLSIGDSTDLSGVRRGVAMDYVGVAGGVRLAKHYPLAEGGRTIDVVTTLAGRYAYGWGHANGVAFQGDSESPYTITTVLATAHEMAFNLASGVSF